MYKSGKRAYLRLHGAVKILWRSTRFWSSNHDVYTVSKPNSNLSSELKDPAGI
jgi:hypothetical protein